MAALDSCLRVLRQSAICRYIDRALRRSLSSLQRHFSMTKTSRCVVCWNKFEHNSTSLVRPCRDCEEFHCDQCLRSMFTAAISDVTRMPPRCCRLLQLYTAIDFLTDDEVSSYRSKFEEWMTHDKTYCPKPTCSAFVSPLEITAVLAKSNVGRAIVDCPKCSTSICTACKNVGHEGPCDTKRREEELAMLIRYDYKQCPNCHHAIKKMFGCDHMVCICGGQFCWSCLQPTNVCDGCGRYSDEEEHEQVDAEERGGVNDTGQESGPNCPFIVEGEDAQDVQASAEEANFERRSPVSITCEPRSEPIREVNEVRRDLAGDNATLSPDATESMDSMSTANETSVAVTKPILAETTTLALEISNSAANVTPGLDERHINLDSGGWRRWGHEDIDFGDEPGQQPSIVTWWCHHRFKIFEDPGKDYNNGNLARMECNRCFRSIVPHNPVVAAHDKPSACGAENQHPSAGQSGIALMDFASREEQMTQEEQRAREQAWVCGRCNIMMCVDCK